MNIRHSVRRFLVSKVGATAVEYIVMLACFAIVCILAIQASGPGASAVPSHVNHVNTLFGGS
jgi:Flp pilus assembly pilin Flp